MTAEQTLNQIQNRVAYIQAKLRQAVELLLERKVEQTRQNPTADALERCVDHWRFLVPEAVDARAQLLRRMRKLYVLSPEQHPKTLEALGASDAGVKAAYVDLYGETPQHLFKDGAQAEQVPDNTSPAAALLRELRWLYIRRGEVLYWQGDESDALYGVIDGRLRATIVDPKKDAITIDVHAGEIIGEEAIVEDARRSATVTALRDSNLVCFSQEGYERLVEKYPQGMARLGLQLVHRMQRIAGVVPALPDSQAIVVIPASDGVADFVSRLVRTLSHYEPTLHLHPDNLSEVMPVELSTSLEAVIEDYHFVDWVRKQEAEYPIIVYEAHPAYPNWTRRAIERADRILIVGREGASPERTPTELILDSITHPQLVAPREFAMVRDKRAHPVTGTLQWIDRREITRHYHVALDDDGGFKRLGRFLRDEAVGLVLGGGGIRAAAHVGAFRAIQEAGLSLDVIGGTSSGAIIAAMIAMGWDAEKIDQQMKAVLLRREVLVNPTLPIVSLSSAHRLSQAYEQLFGETRIEDMWTNCFTISANLTQATQSINRYGRLRDAVRYSTSIAGIFPPAPDPNGDIHIDGGIFNNTPADVMRWFIGNGEVIAIDLGFTEREKIQYHYGDSLSGFELLWRWSNPFAKRLRVPNIMAILMRSNALASINVTSEQVAQADLLVRPPVNGYGLFNMQQFDVLQEIGYQSMKDALAEYAK